jgi:hypothetical protein
MRPPALLAAVLATALVAVFSACATDFDCSLNGVCDAGVCTCDSPWSGTACETLLFAVTPASGKDLWTGNTSLNTWNGPIVHSPDGMYHLYDPVYDHESLWNVIYTAHGIASDPTGPYDWSSRANISVAAINPAALVFTNSTTGSTVYSVWIGGVILLAASADGPFVPSPYTYPGGDGSNPAPVFHNGTFFLTNQGTTEIWSTPSLDKPWTQYATITHPPNLPYTVEDPVMWIDPRGNWHVRTWLAGRPFVTPHPLPSHSPRRVPPQIINHAYNTAQTMNCSTSHVSSHFFSTDTVTWGHSDQPYGHTVVFDDGTWHSYCTLERPNLVFSDAGLITHLNVAVDLVTGNEGCAARGKGCVDCKYDDHAGTLIIALGSQ